MLLNKNIKFDLFLCKARDVHEERFQYDRSSWGVPEGRTEIHVKILCSKHGWFSQGIYTHLSSKGCSECSLEERLLRTKNSGWNKFILKAKKKHNNKFQYDKNSWVGLTYKVKIFCSKHKWFKQIAYDHLNSGGCYSCQRENMQIKLKEKYYSSFLIKAKEKYGNKFAYDISYWKGSKNKMNIKCLKHGWFEQMPYDHLKHLGCKKCCDEKFPPKPKKTKEHVLKLFQEKHGNRYSYDLMKYKNMSHSIEIVCTTHGSFYQTPSNHLTTNGCKKCSGRHKWTTKEFIENSKKVHGNKFKYDKSIYNGALRKIIITCKKHGDFITQPSRHIIRKDGCPGCSIVKETNIEIFLERAFKKFKKRYDYSLVEYVNVITPVKIICKLHGVFEQPPAWHLSSKIGCPKCTYSVSSKESRWLDSLNLPKTTERQTKILLGGKKRSVDAYDSSLNKVYEFWGDWWHGHPEYFDPYKNHPLCKKTYGQLYKETLQKRDLIINAGYTLIEIWEHDFDKLEGKAGKKPRLK